MRASRIPVEYEASLLGANEYDEDSMTTTRSILLQFRIPELEFRIPELEYRTSELYHPTKAVSLLKWHGFFISQVDLSRIWSGTRFIFQTSQPCSNSSSVSTWQSRQGLGFRFFD